MLGAKGRISSQVWLPDPAPSSRKRWRKGLSVMADILNLAIPHFGPIFIGFACGKTLSRPRCR
jgi:hypothetical protein